MHWHVDWKKLLHNQRPLFLSFLEHALGEALCRCLTQLSLVELNKDEQCRTLLLMCSTPSRLENDPKANDGVRYFSAAR